VLNNKSSVTEDHARGLSTFTVMAGLGGSLGYFLGALNWENTFLGKAITRNFVENQSVHENLEHHV
jgi:hypothetical protein